MRCSKKIPLLSLLLLCILSGVFPSGGVSLAQFGEAQKLNISFDAVTGSGYMEKSGTFVAFAVGQPYIVLDWARSAKVPAPYLTDNVVFLPEEFTRAALGYFSRRNQPGAAGYSIATILIDPGHGGKDTGAISEVGGMRLLEKDLTLEVSKRVVELLESRFPGRNILITRKGDTYPTLEQRVAMANSVGLEQNEAVIYVSIHANASFNKTARGFEVWYLNPDYRRTVVSPETVKEKGSDIAPMLIAFFEETFTTESIILARKVYDRLGAEIGTQSPGRGIRAEEWFVVRNANMPSILIEMGFMTNPDEGALLSGTGYLRRIGDAIYNGIVDFIEHFER